MCADKPALQAVCAQSRLRDVTHRATRETAARPGWLSRERNQAVDQRREHVLTPEYRGYRRSAYPIETATRLALIHHAIARWDALDRDPRGELQEPGATGLEQGDYLVAVRRARYSESR